MKRSIDYKILILKSGIYFNVGTIVIRTYSGDIYYTPSTRVIDDLEFGDKEIGHIAWHASGRVHIKHKNVDKYLIIEKEANRQKISEIGLQELIQDTIEDFQQLLRYKKKVTELDVVLDVIDYVGPVVFRFSMVSGKLIVAFSEGQKVPIKPVDIKKEGDGITSTRRALGYHSGSGDVMLQYSLSKAVTDKLRTNRQIFIPHDMKISK